ncbi:MAG: DUF4105 domain-containing protein [Taibaiella sp.]|nr:DUF4105 domain-containing protein [Taibaiella sp.]
MDKKFFFFLIALFAGFVNYCTAQVGDTTGKTAAVSAAALPLPEDHIRISFVTCGPGFEEIYQVFGHTAVRIIDSSKQTDLVYNYGTFNGFEENFELQFMRGKLLYYLSVYPFNAFIEEYVEQKRSVSERELLITAAEKKEIKSFLEWNALPENRGYKYDFFFDNCATRIRDIFPEALGKNFKYGPLLPASSRITFRNIINQYFYTTLWERFGINILLGSRIDRVMTDKDIMFLPDYLEKSIGASALNGLNVTDQAQRLLPGNPPPTAPVDGPFLLTCGIAILTIAGLSVKKLKLLGNVMSKTLLFITGLLGCLILVMWFGTDHQGCGNNFNVLWALPTNIYIAFAKPKGKERYAIVAMGLIFITVVLHITGVQQLILKEFSPLLLALLYIYGTIYKQSTIKTN